MGRPWKHGGVAALGVFLTLSGFPASAEPTHDQGVASSGVELGALLERVGKHAQQLEQMEKRASFLLSGRMEELDGQGRLKGEKELVVRVTATPSKRITEILRYFEDGADKTAEAREEHKSDKPRNENPKTKFVVPFSPTVKERYRFTLVEHDGKTPGRVRIAFKPLERAANAFVGSAWVDVASGEILTMGVSPTKTPVFVDHIEVQVRLENRTSLGRAPSELSFQAEGGLLFIRKHYRGSATLSEAKISF